ncbi:MAG TPA: hypothetical protein VL418_12565 [Devosiaceae bacterium]|nr:hypothetical protein [Devosiaceae bacterium]
MDILNDILLWLHFLGLAAGGGALIAAGILARLVPTSPPEQRAGLMKFGGVISSVGRGGLAILIVTGPLMLWLKWGGRTPSDAWFGIKMIFVLLVVIGVVMSGIGLRRMRNGDASAVRLATQGRILASIALVLTILAAAVTFG